jgi:hypothetical protein
MKDLAHCEVCDQRVGTTYGTDAEGRRRVMPHKTRERADRVRWRVEWCEGRFERKEGRS